MCARWIFLCYLLYIHLDTITCQYYESNEDYFEEPEDLRDAEEYDEEPFEYTHHKTNRRKNIYTRASSDECRCSCQRCKKPEPKPCCREVCYYCEQTETNYATEVPQNPKLVFLPYPVPLVVPDVYKNNTDTTTTKSPATTKEPVTTKATTTQKSTTKSALRTSSLEEMISGHHRTLKELNPSTKTKTRPSWIPKYGIVPIPDHLAAKLMSQLIEVRALKGKKKDLGL